MEAIFKAYEGRSTRFQWWKAQLAIALLVLTAFVVSVFTIARSINKASGSSPDLVGTLIMSFCFLTIIVWLQTAICAKRYHDLGKSGWWALISLVPIFVWITQFTGLDQSALTKAVAYIVCFCQTIQLGFFRGDTGENQFDVVKDSLAKHLPDAPSGAKPILSVGTPAQSNSAVLPAGNASFGKKSSISRM